MHCPQEGPALELRGRPTLGLWAASLAGADMPRNLPGPLADASFKPSCSCVASKIDIVVNSLTALKMQRPRPRYPKVTALMHPNGSIPPEHFRYSPRAFSPRRRTASRAAPQARDRGRRSWIYGDGHGSQGLWCREASWLGNRDVRRAGGFGCKNAGGIRAGPDWNS